MARNKEKKIGLIGCGNMGFAILNGVCDSPRHAQTQIFVYDKDTKKTHPVKNMRNVHVCRSLTELVKASDIILICVKPQNLDVLSVALQDLSLKRKTLVSILAGKTLKRLQKAFGADVALIRLMPNLGLVVGAGVTAMCSNKNTTQRAEEEVVALFSSSGKVINLPEKNFDAVTAISGSGPAYFFYVSELLIDAAVKQGIPCPQAKMLVAETAYGAGAVMSGSEEGPAVWRKRVTSPQGTTEAALSVLMNKRMESDFQKAVEKATDRSKELSK